MKVLPLRFKDEETLEYVKLICRRKNINLPDYIVDNFEWDDKPICVILDVPPSENVCTDCEFNENCPDRVKK